MLVLIWYQYQLWYQYYQYFDQSIHLYCSRWIGALKLFLPPHSATKSSNYPTGILIYVWNLLWYSFNSWMKQWISPAAAFSFSYFSCLETSIPAHHHSMSTLGDKFSPKVQCVYMLHDKVNISFPSHNHRHRTCNTMQPIHTPVQLHNTVIRLCLQLIMFIIYIYI